MNEEIKKLLEDIKDTLEHIVASEEWETLKETSSADLLIERINKLNKDYNYWNILTPNLYPNHED
tara:strand:+ start:924 stop:1118 length:195 start_codon:yes stop_codon:yes gene_type:complete